MSRIVEVKEYWNNRTLAELKIKLYNTRKALEDAQELIKKNAKELLNLDINSTDYLTKLKINTEYIRNAERTIRESTRELNILSELLVTKEPNVDIEADYHSYIESNKKDIEVIANNIDNVDKSILGSIIQSIRTKAGNIENLNINDSNSLEVQGDKASLSFEVVGEKTYSYVQDENTLVFV
jgi:hypothetical protein